MWSRPWRQGVALCDLRADPQRVDPAHGLQQPRVTLVQLKPSREGARRCLEAPRCYLGKHWV